MADNKRIAVIMLGDIYDRKGMFNAILNRVKHLQKWSGYDIEVFTFLRYDNWLVRKMRHTVKRDTPKSVVIDGIRINIHWRPYSIIDYVLSIKLHLPAVFSELYFSRKHRMLRGYDLVIAHYVECGKIALTAKRKWNIPYTITWHGSDIHSLPFASKSVFHDTREVIENADANLFVSQNLCDTSSLISENGIKHVLYNGCDKRFRRYSDIQRRQLRERFGVVGKKVVTFVGNFIDIKNVLAIPDIAMAVLEKRPDVEVWMIGDGKYDATLRSRMQGLNTRFWGKRMPEEIPDFLNATDVFILPSKNEGLPLTLVEALNCGCHAIGSRIGGIPEIIGTDNTVALDSPSFVADFAHKIIAAMEDDRKAMPAASCFDWDEIAKKEIAIINSILK